MDHKQTSVGPSFALLSLCSSSLEIRNCFFCFFTIAVCSHWIFYFSPCECHRVWNKNLFPITFWSFFGNAHSRREKMHFWTDFLQPVAQFSLNFVGKAWFLDFGKFYWHLNWIKSAKCFKAKNRGKMFWKGTKKHKSVYPETQTNKSQKKSTFFLFFCITQSHVREWRGKKRRDSWNFPSDYGLLIFSHHIQSTSAFHCASFMQPLLKVYCVVYDSLQLFFMVEKINQALWHSQ